MVLGYFSGFEHYHGQKNSSTPVDKIAKIRSQPPKYNVFCGIEANNIISSVTQYSHEGKCLHRVQVFISFFYDFSKK